MLKLFSYGKNKVWNEVVSMVDSAVGRDSGSCYTKKNFLFIDIDPELVNFDNRDEILKIMDFLDKKCRKRDDKVFNDTVFYKFLTFYVVFDTLCLK